MESLAVIGGSAYLPCSIRKHDMASGLRELIALSLLAGLGFGLALAHGDLLFAAFWRCHRKDGGRRRLVKGALAMRKVAVYIAFVLSTAWLLFGSWQLPQTVSGNYASREATNDYWQDAPRAPMTDEGDTEAKVPRAEGEQLANLHRR
jgi:MFS family permease